jgi:hypothetical protein
MNASRSQQILALLSEKGQLSMTGFLKEIQNVSRFTLHRNLRELTLSGKVIMEGNRKSAVYKLSPSHSLRELVNRPPQLKSPVGFQPEFLEGYRPNQTYFLSESDRQVLQRLGKLPRETIFHKRAMESLLIDLSWASSRFEGSSLSWLETKTIIEFGENAVKTKDRIGVQLTLNHKNAIEYICRNPLKIQSSDLKDIHALLSKNLLNRKEQEGALRESLVSISGSSYSPPDNPWKIKEYFEEFCNKASRIENPYEQAFFVMAMLPYIQPFEDANKRTSRIAMNIPLIREGFCPFSFLHTEKLKYNEGMAAIYEHTNTDLLRECFVEGYIEGTKHYKVTEEYQKNNPLTPPPQKRSKRSSNK